MLKVTEKREVLVVLALLLLSAAIVMLQTFSLERSLVINGSGSVRAEARDDRPSGGASVSAIKQTKRGVELTCDLKLGDFEWPYCEVVVDLSRSEIDGVKNGIDLSRFDRVGLWLKQGESRQPSIRFQLHNYNPIYSTPGERETSCSPNADSARKTTIRHCSCPIWPSSGAHHYAHENYGLLPSPCHCELTPPG